MDVGDAVYLVPGRRAFRCLEIVEADPCQLHGLHGNKEWGRSTLTVDCCLIPRAVAAWSTANICILQSVAVSGNTADIGRWRRGGPSCSAASRGRLTRLFLYVFLLSVTFVTRALAGAAGLRRIGSRISYLARGDVWTRRANPPKKKKKNMAIVDDAHQTVVLKEIEVKENSSLSVGLAPRGRYD